MFPTQRKSQSPHVTPTSYKKTWAAVKDNFNLKDEGRLYDARHTFVKNALNTGVPVEDVSKLTGHSLETLFKHYVEKYTSDATAAAIGSFQSNKEINNGFLDQNSNIPETVKEILDAYIDLKAKKGQTPTLHDFIERMKVYRDERSLTPTARLWLEKFE
ncbi:Phage integrase family protein [compost metagenome]